jgi:hypothetical protein
MKKIILILISGFSVAFMADAQSIERSVIGSAGAVSAAGGVILTWTVGETVINTASAGSVILTQGFQQPEQGTSSVDPIRLETGLAVYPNPSNGIFSVAALDNAGIVVNKVAAEVRDAAGKLVFSHNSLDLTSGTNTLDLTKLPGGFYSLSLNAGNDLTATYKLTIIK